jgi:hypothetical protein
MSDLKKGDYVLATKWGDGDPQDHWCVGFFSHMLRDDRYIVVDDKGVPFRASGFRRVKRISPRRGKWLLNNAKWIELSNKSVWEWARASMSDAA